MSSFWRLEHLLPEYVKNFEAYTPSRPDRELMKLYGCSSLHRLNNNENPLGPSSEAQKAILAFESSKAAIYPSGDSYYLRLKLAEKFDKTPDQFLVGNGANEVITFAIKAFCEQGDNVVTADKTFAVYEWVAKFSGYEAKLAPLTNFEFDEQRLLDLIDNRTKIVFICNPNNPTGSFWNITRFRSFMEAIDGEKIVIVDEAYAEFVEDEKFPNCLDLIEEYDNLVVFRTFSKMYGLAGLRIGYLCAQEAMVDAIKKTCVVYSVNSIAQIAAVSSLDSDEHIFRTRKLVHESKSFLTQNLNELSLDYVSGEGNFLMVKLPISDTLAYRKLMTRGLMVRTMSGFRFPGFIRISLSHLPIMEELVDGLKKILK
ncbi:MAG: histidinol-phosphate transaminase [Syntrophaceae bacterium]|nr:histidinol-phosphate transaminase [Syntrophaceae bacterium]